MPVQKTDLVNKKKQLEEMKLKEKHLEQQLELRTKKSLQQKSPVEKKTTTTSKKATTPRRTKTSTTSSTLMKPTASTVARNPKTSAAGEEASPRTTSATVSTPKTVKKKTDATRSSSVTRRKKSKEKLIKKSPEPAKTKTDALLFFGEDTPNTSNGGDVEMLMFEQQQTVNGVASTNPFSSHEQDHSGGGGMDIFGGGNINPFNASGVCEEGFTGDSILENGGSNNSLVNLQEDVIFEEEDHARSMSNNHRLTNNDQRPATNGTAAAEEYYFPEDDDEHFQETTPDKFTTPEKSIFSSDDFPENESESELFQYEEDEDVENENKHESEEQEGDSRDDVDDDENAYYEEGEDEEDVGLQEKIRREIHQDHLREMDLQSERKDHDRAARGDDQDDEEELRERMGSLYSRSIQSLHEYEDDESEADSENDEGEKSDHLTTAERIQLELLVQDQKEQELKEIHRSLSRENVFNYDSSGSESERGDDDEEEDNEEDQHAGSGGDRDTRTMILEEMEFLKEREKELKRRRSFREGKEYDSSEEYEIENDYENQETRDQNQHVAKQTTTTTVMEKIHWEMQELESREKELQKTRGYHNRDELGELSDFLSTSLEDSTQAGDNPGKLTKKPMFGSRDDLVKYLGTSEPSKETQGKQHQQQTKKPAPKRDKQNSVRIPKVFKKMEAEAAKAANTKLQEPDNRGNARSKTPDIERNGSVGGGARMKTPKEEETKRRSKQVTVESSKEQMKKQIRQLESLLPHDTEEQQYKQPPPKIKSPIAPSQVTKLMTQEWEHRSQEENAKKQQIEREIKRKKEEYLKLLQEKAKLEDNHRLQEEGRIREYEEKERMRQLTKQKKQGLNQLWLSGKSLVTVDDNPDYHDEDLLSYTDLDRDRMAPSPSNAPSTTTSKQNNKIVEQRKQQQQQQQQQQQHNEPAPPLKISKTIKRWEKIIKKNTTDTQ